MNWKVTETFGQVYYRANNLRRRITIVETDEAPRSWRSDGPMFNNVGSMSAVFSDLREAFDDLSSRHGMIAMYEISGPRESEIVVDTKLPKAYRDEVSVEVLARRNRNGTYYSDGI